MPSCSSPTIRTVRKRYDPNEIILYGLAEAAEYLGISKQNLAGLRKAGRMISPVAELQCGPIWSQSQLDEQRYLWAGRHGKREARAEPERPESEQDIAEQAPPSTEPGHVPT